MLNQLLLAEPSPGWINPDNTPHNIIATYDGWVHMYAVFITTGMILAVFASYIRLKTKKVPVEPLIWAVFIIIPFSLFGTSFFGKYNEDPSQPLIGYDGGVPFWSLFAFWKAGLSVHGGVLFGVVVGIIVFAFVARKSRVSMWVYIDCIVPNILLGQVLGRWGNFFNHELLGYPVSYETLKWLPAFIRDNCFQWVGDHPELIPGTGNIQWRAPIFLYESFWNFILWVILTFVIPNFSKVLGPKLWKKDPQKYPFDFKYSVRHFFNRKIEEPDKMTWKELWDKAFYYNNPTQKQLEQIKPKKFKETSSPTINRLKKWWVNDAKELTRLNNPEGYWITRSGVQAGLYFFGWNLIRFVLETQRENGADLFVMNNRPLDYAMLWMIAIFGLLMTAYAQWFAPIKLRKNGYLYEKEYVDYTNLANWKLEYYLQHQINYNQIFQQQELETLIKTKVMTYLGYENKNFEEYFSLIDFKVFSHHDHITSFTFKIMTRNQPSNIFSDEISCEVALA